MDKKKTVLIVDDDDALANMYIAHLNLRGFLTQRVKNGEDALAAAMKFKPDVILLDVMMPIIDGFDVLDILRNTPSTANIPIIMLTALNAKEDQDRARDLGVDVYLEKSSVDLESISTKIKEMLRIS